MDIIAGLILLIGLILIVKNMSGKKQNKKNTRTEKLPLKEVVKKTFPKYKIIEKHQTIMICEINHRNEPDELIFIRIKPNEAKKIRKSGRMLICDYPQNPTAQEMLSDFQGHL
jgi:hypothetical protein